MQKPSVVAVIPARGGSKGLAKKNVKVLGGRPLIDWTIDAASHTPGLNCVLVSTDDPGIADIAKRAGARVPFMRPQGLAGDDVHSSSVVLHALEWLSLNEGFEPDIVVMLLPTSPFRTPQQIEESISLLRRTSCPAVIGVTRVNKHPAAFRVLRDGALAPLIQTAELNVQRQDGEDLYAVNGALYVAWSALFRAHRTFHIDGALPQVIPPLNAVDIDTLEDLEIAEVLACSFFRSNK